MFIGLIEWDSSYDPTIIVGPDPGTVRRDSVRALTRTDPDTGDVRLVWDDDGEVDDEPAFLDANPAPDLDDPHAVRAWLEALRQEIPVPWVSLYGPDETPSRTQPAQTLTPDIHLTFQTTREAAAIENTHRTESSEPSSATIREQAAPSGTHGRRIRIAWHEQVTYEQDIDIEVPDAYTGDMRDLITVDDAAFNEGEVPGVPVGYRSQWLERTNPAAVVNVQDRHIINVKSIDDI